MRIDSQLARWTGEKERERESDRERQREKASKDCLLECLGFFLI